MTDTSVDHQSLCHHYNGCQANLMLNFRRQMHHNVDTRVNELMCYFYHRGKVNRPNQKTHKCFNQFAPTTNTKKLTDKHF